MSIPNGVMMQFFHWYVPSDGTLWNELASNSGELAQAGITALWLPPAYKGMFGDQDVGYSVYDRYDLGEFDQKGSVRTKYGTRQEYVNAIEQAKQHGLSVYADIVMNHMMGADHQEEFNATPYHPDNRLQAIGPKQPIKAWTQFDFSGRDGKYCDMAWHWWHFNAVDNNEYAPQGFEAVYLFEGKSFDNQVDLEKGSYDYLMGCDLDVNNPEVVDALKRWGEWYVDLTDLDGFRFDAVKHVEAGFFPQWLRHMQRYSGRHLFSVGEYWSGNVKALHRFLDITNETVALFDAPLHFNFYTASVQGSDYNMSTILDNSLVETRPHVAVTMVDNHDSQPCQALESPVADWFKPLAYALILLRRDGYPCIFYADYYGACYTDTDSDGNKQQICLTRYKALIDKMLSVRQQYAHGEQLDYFDHFSTIGWTRLGTPQHPGGMAVVLSNGDTGYKWMNVGNPNQDYIDVTGHVAQPVTTNEHGWAQFWCEGRSVSVWIPKKA